MNGATGAYGTAAVLVATAMGAARVILLANPEPSTHGPTLPTWALQQVRQLSLMSFKYCGHN